MWHPDMVTQVRQRIAEIIDMADQDALDVLRSRAVEQEVLDTLDEPTPPVGPIGGKVGY